MVRKLQRKSYPKAISILILTITIAAATIYILFIRSNGSVVAPSPAKSSTSIQRKVPYDAYAEIPKDEIQQGGGIVEIMWSPKETPIVAIVYIDSIDGGRAYNIVTNTPSMLSTYGKMTVLRSFRGPLHQGDTVKYGRGGGIVTYDEYWETLNDAQKENLLFVYHGQKPPHKKYFKYSFADDIDIEAGKRYLAYAAPVKANDGHLLEYAITGLQYGLREIRDAGKNTEVLDSGTGIWEPLGSVLYRSGLSL